MFEESSPDLDRAELFADGARGIYIPQHFAESVRRDLVTGVTAWAWAACEAGPEHDDYWHAWDEITSRAEIEHPTLGRCYLWQDGDLWVIPFNA